MENIFQVIALVSAGAALITGLISLMIGFRKDGERVDRIFGIQAICFFVFLVLPPTGYIIDDRPPYPVSLEIKRIFIWTYYILLPFFFEAYTGQRRKFFTPAIVFAAASTYLLMIFSGAGVVMPAWRALVYLPLGLILVYGMVLARGRFRDGARADATWLLAAMGLYAFSYGMSLFEAFAHDFFVALFGRSSFFPFHINTLAFIFIMTLRIRSNAFNSYRLEKMLRLRNESWERLVQHVQAMIIKLDKDGKIAYMNPFAMRCLGYGNPGEIMGRNFFETCLHPLDAEAPKARFRQILETGIIAENEHTRFITRNREERLVHWSGVISQDDEGINEGVLIIGLDTTALDHAFQEVEGLRNELHKENVLLNEVVEQEMDHGIIGQSAAILYAVQKARQVAGTHATVLLEGETGVGKELFASLIHHASSRSQMPFIRINCAALPAELIESELFGHEKGSFTGAVQTRKGRFELADGGTIFLDEIGEMPLALQPKLLRVLQSGEFERVGGQKTIRVDVRVISATNRDLQREIREGMFREDLYYRLNVFPITIPALRNRKEDIPMLVNHFIRKFALEFKSPVDSISRADLQRLVEHPWPGNIRELINLVERSVISSPGNTLKISWEQKNGAVHGLPPAPLAIKDLERIHIIKVLGDCGWRINGEGGAAEKLGLNPNTLRSRMKKLNISRAEA